MDRMKDYRQLIKELPSNTVVFAFGRFQPPTALHELQVKVVKKLAEEHKSDYVIYASRDHKEELLSEDKKVQYMNLMFPHTNIKTSETTSIVEAAKELNKKYKKLVLVTSSDLKEDAEKILNKKNGTDYQFESIEVIVAGDVDPESNKLCESAKKGDFVKFKAGLPAVIREIDSRRLMNDIRQGLGLEIVKEEIKLVKNELREQYFRKEIFNVGDIVEHNGNKLTIIKRGSNHLLLKEQTGNLISKWIQDVTPTEEKDMNEDLTTKTLRNTDAIKVARMIANMLGIDNAEASSSPNNLVNRALYKIRTKTLNAETLNILNKMLSLATQVGIVYDNNLVPSKLKEGAIQPNATDKVYGDGTSVDTYSEKDKKKKFAKGQEITFEQSDMTHELDDKYDSEQIKIEQPHTSPGHTLASRDDHHRRRKVKYHLGEATALEKFRKAAAEREKKHDAIEAKRKADAEQGKENMSGAIDRLEKSLKESHVEFRLDHRDKVTGDHKPTFADHEAKVSDTTDKATYVKVPSHKADSFKAAMKSKHGVRVELAESILNPNDPHGDYKAKSKALQDLSMNKDVDQKAVQQRKLDLDKEYDKVKTEAKQPDAYDHLLTAADKSTLGKISVLMQKQKQKKKVVKESRNQADKYWDEAEKHKETANKHPVGSEAYHLHMSNHYDAKHRYHSDLGQHSSADRAADRAEEHHMKSLQASETGLAEAHKLGDKVQIVKGAETGEIGTVGEIRHGAFKDAPKTYTIDTKGGSIQLKKTHIKRFKESYEEVELVEGKMGQIHADIEDHLGNHLANYKKVGGAEHFGNQTVKTAEHIAKLHKIEPKHAQKFVNDYVDAKLKEEVELEESRGHKVIASFLKNREVAQRAFTGQNKPAEKKEDKSKIKMNPTIKDDSFQLGNTNAKGYDAFFEEDDKEDEISDKEIDKMVDSVGEEDLMEVYEDDELTIIDEETGEEILQSEDEKSNESSLMEVLSRSERMKARARFARTKSKRERSTRIALKMYSSSTKINQRARRLAIKLLKKRLLRGRDISKISIGEKERIERVVQKRKPVIDRIAMKLTTRIRQIEKARLAHNKFTKSAPTVAF